MCIYLITQKQVVHTVFIFQDRRDLVNSYNLLLRWERYQQKLPHQVPWPSENQSRYIHSINMYWAHYMYATQAVCVYVIPSLSNMQLWKWPYRNTVWYSRHYEISCVWPMWLDVANCRITASQMSQCSLTFSAQCADCTVFTVHHTLYNWNGILYGHVHSCMF